MGSIKDKTNYLDEKPNGMSLETYVVKRLIKHFDGTVEKKDYSNLYLDIEKYDEEEFTSGFWLFKNTYKQWKQNDIFRVYSDSGDVIIESYSTKLTLEMIYQMFGEVIKDLDSDIVFKEEKARYSKMNNKPIEYDYGYEGY